MKINGKDITEYSARVRQWRFNPGVTEIDNDSEWVRGSPLPFFMCGSAGWKSFDLTLMVYGDSREDIHTKISYITAALLAPAKLEIDDWVHKFCGVLKKYTVREYSDSSRRRWQTVELQIEGYEYGDEVIATTTGAGTVTVNNPGSLASPAILELTPTFGAAETTITGLCRDSLTGADLPVTVRNLVTGKKIILDGASGLITQDGAQKAADVDMWALPSLPPGSSTVIVGTDSVNLTLKVLPIFM